MSDKFICSECGENEVEDQDDICDDCLMEQEEMGEDE